MYIDKFYSETNMQSFILDESFEAKLPFSNVFLRSNCLYILQGTLCAARRAAAFVRGDDVIHKLFTELAYRYK